MKLMMRPLLTALLVLFVLCAHCNVAKPTSSMTRIQEVFRTLMGPKPMMLASRGKKSASLLGGGVPNVREYLDAAEGVDAGPFGSAAAAEREPHSYWIVADERLPVVAVRNYWAQGERRRR